MQITPSFQPVEIANELPFFHDIEYAFIIFFARELPFRVSTARISMITAARISTRSLRVPKSLQIEIPFHVKRERERKREVEKGRKTQEEIEDDGIKENRGKRTGASWDETTKRAGTL